MTGPTYALYALLLLGDGQETERRPIADGLTAEKCLTQLITHQPSVAVVDLGYGLEAVETVFGCEQEPAGDRESALAVREMFEAAAREDMRP
jgi:hypothetical protein